MTIGERVKARRIELGLTQEELAKRIGYSERFTISKIERGQPIKQSTVVKLANALHTTPSYLMGWADINGNEIKDETLTDKLLCETGINVT